MQYLTDLLNIDNIKQELIDLRKFNKELIIDNEKKDKLIKAVAFENNNYINISDNIIMTEIQCKYNFQLSLDIKNLSNKNKELIYENKKILKLYKNGELTNIIREKNLELILKKKITG